MAEKRPPREPESTPQTPAKDALRQSIVQPKCDLCGSLMLEVHCKLVCPMCGYQRDCTDP